MRCPQRADLKGKVCAKPSRLIQQLKQRTAYRVLEILRQKSGHTACRKRLAPFRLPETVHDQAPYRVWQRRYYVMNIFTEKKRLEKLRYRHGNPVKRGLVASPDQGPWSSFRFYHLEDLSVLRMDRLNSSRQVSVLQPAQT